jgi:hypothetical protein
MRAPNPPLSPKAREAAAVSHVVGLIRAKVRETRVLSDDAFPQQEFGEEYETAMRVRVIVNFLQDIFATFDERSPWGNRSDNKNTLAALGTHLSALQDLLVKLPGGVRMLLFPSMSRDDDFLARLADAKPAMRQCVELIESLGELRRRVDGMLDKIPGERGNANFPHRITAYCSAEIFKYYDLKPSRGNEDKTSLFEQVASSLFEAATGEAGASLTRACRDIIDGKFIL